MKSSWPPGTVIEEEEEGNISKLRHVKSKKCLKIRERNDIEKKREAMKSIERKCFENRNIENALGVK